MISYDALIKKEKSVAVVGLGYVGLPLAIELAKHFDVIGFDIKEKRVAELRAGHDNTNEVSDQELGATKALLTSDPEALAKAGVLIVAVPTPIDSHRNPDLRPVFGASKTVGAHMQKGSVVCYESTVYPGVTEDECVPILEAHSHLTFGQDFTVGYSPERINPGDTVHRLATIRKIVAGSDKETADLLAKVYGRVVTAGIHRASSIKVAEAAKVIENTQRDINIALMNELALIFNRMGIDTLEVLEAAGSKWNFLPFRPGLVGGHCIGVDPYYLTFKAEEIGCHPEVILAGRKINDNMGKYIAEVCVKRLINAGTAIKGARVGILGFTFKENVPDIRNTRVIDIVRELAEFGVQAFVHDPCADTAETEKEYGIRLLPISELRDLDALIIAVGHKDFTKLTAEDCKKLLARPNAPVLDIKGILDKKSALDQGLALWRL
ncbi:MAG: nucleotide sugar dehydrogenase [Desulfovibrionaceae bacterium]|nr:nucleotide sugar dehydrogenase [Desulfovibrionaceae bacterium]